MIGLQTAHRGVVAVANADQYINMAWLVLSRTSSFLFLLYYFYLCILFYPPFSFTFLYDAVRRCLQRNSISLFIYMYLTTSTRCAAAAKCYRMTVLKPLNLRLYSCLTYSTSFFTNLTPAAIFFIFFYLNC